jgi:predicted patatin/cPLA2 family phospholipase
MSLIDAIPGHNPRAVLDLIDARRSAPTVANGRRLGLVVEGGAMRGVYTSGSLLALHLMGYCAAFDDLYGSSGGAVNGAHFLSGVGHTKVATYYRWLASSKFINPWRLSRMVDIDYFVDEVLTSLEKVEVELVGKARTELWVSVVNEQTAEVEIRNARREGVPLLLLLKAAVAIPVVYSRSIAIDENTYLDAGFVQPFPLSPAIEAGCTDVLVLTARPVEYRSSPHRWYQRELFNRRCARGNSKLRELYRASWEAQNRQRQLADGTTPSGRDVNIATLAPVEARVGKTTTEATLLRDETTRMCRRVLDVFGVSHSGLEQLIAEGIV